ncbi:MAG: transcriptional regulator [Gallionellales bacterium RIFCSPLOWO2_02_FULL_57_47]|nr:MAG: transcriptional regulator [Gallionellales bacterium RIFCSPLOWO2_02_FULL_57_47]
MKTLAVFDPAISCFDPVLVQFAADLAWVEKHGVKVSRHNLGKEPQAFAANPAVAREMEAGMNRLPVIMVDGHIVSTGMYPSREQLAQKLGIAAPPEEISPVKAVACPCTPWIN